LDKSVTSQRNTTNRLTQIIHDAWNRRADAVSSLILGPLLRTSEVQSVFRLKASNTL